VWQSALGCVGIARAWNSGCTRVTLVHLQPLVCGTRIWHRIVWLVGVKVWSNVSASIFSNKKLLVICLALVLRGFAVCYQHFGEPYCLQLQGFIRFLWFMSLYCSVGGYQTFGGRSCVCPQGKSHYTAQFWQCAPSVRRNLSGLKLYAGLNQTEGAFCTDLYRSYAWRCNTAGLSDVVPTTHNGVLSAWSEIALSPLNNTPK
jgi:hypothetical protein